MAKPQPSEFAVVDSFNKAFPELANTSGPKGTASDQQRDRDVREAYRDAIRQKWVNVTVVNLHRFPLDLNMAQLGHLTVPGRKEGTLYFKLVIDQPRADMRDMGDAKYNVKMVFPKALAEDIVREYEETGGVFFYEGTGEVPTEQLANAKDAQIRWHWLMFAEGNRMWAEKRNAMWISDRMRDAAKDLVALKLVAAAPEWVTISRAESPDAPCEGCGQTIAKVAKFCPTCKQIFDPEWVRARRPDIWNAVFGVPVSAAAKVDASGGSEPNLNKFIAEELANTPTTGKKK